MAIQLQYIITIVMETVIWKKIIEIRYHTLLDGV